MPNENAENVSVKEKDLLSKIAPSISKGLKRAIGKQDMIIKLHSSENGTLDYKIFNTNVDNNAKYENGRFVIDKTGSNTFKQFRCYYANIRCGAYYLQEVTRLTKRINTTATIKQSNNGIPLNTIAPTISDMLLEDLGHVGSVSVELLTKSKNDNPAKCLQYAVFVNGNYVGTLEQKISSKGFSNYFSCLFGKGTVKVEYMEEISKF